VLVLVAVGGTGVLVAVGGNAVMVAVLVVVGGNATQGNAPIYVPFTPPVHAGELFGSL
jgi:hypothetical protein